MNLSERVKVSPEVIARQVGEENVMLDLARGAYYGLDPVGARIWQLLAEGRTLEEVRDAMAEEYEVSQEAIERDLRTLVDNLVANGLVVPG